MKNEEMGIELNSLSRGTQLELLFNPEQDILNKGDVVTIKDVAINLNTNEIYLTFYEECDLNYMWNSENYKIVGLNTDKMITDE